MKTSKLILILFLCPVLLSAQKTLTGVWRGQLTNDNTEARKGQQFELALTEYKGKVYGYSYTTFISGDTLYYVMKRVKGAIDGGICEITDDEMIGNNFQGRIDKRVKQTITFKISPADKEWHLDGTWKTNKTKEFYSITGAVALKQEDDRSNSEIFQHLKELNLDKDVAVEVKPKVKEEKKKEPVIAAVKTEKPKEEKKKEPEVAAAKPVKQKEEKLKEPKPDKKKEKDAIAKKEAEKKKEEEEIVRKEEEKKKEDIVKNEQKKTEKEIPVIKKEKIEPVKNTEPVVVKTEPKPAAPVIIPPAALLKERINENQKTVYYKNDSLVLALYDNGEVDGDTVSVMKDGELLFSKEGLSTRATKKTIYIPAGSTAPIELILYAENMGKYPPNTGLLVIYDGDQRYEISFSADLQKNASIILRRKE